MTGKAIDQLGRMPPTPRKRRQRAAKAGRKYAREAQLQRARKEGRHDEAQAEAQTKEEGRAKN